MGVRFADVRDHLVFAVDSIPLLFESFAECLDFFISNQVPLAFFFFLFAMVKAMVPRYRYDQLMRLGWKVFLPMSLVAVLVVAGYVAYGGLA